MRIHSLQHVPFEDVGSMLTDIQHHGHSLTTTHWYKGDAAPSINEFDVLIVMGGPMGVYDETLYPWLANEKKLILEAISAGKKIIGICLGAQLIACVLGATVTKNSHREIGWFPLQIPTNVANAFATHPIAEILNDCRAVFHWHGDTFALPPNAQLIASSEACINQAYVINDRIYGFQFHLETTEKSAAALIHHCSDDLDGSLYVQSATTILEDKNRFVAINKAMSRILTYILSA